MAKAKRTTRADSVRVPKGQVDPYKESTKVGRTADFSGVGDYEPAAAGQYELVAESYEWKDPKDNPNRKPAIDPETGKPYQYANVKWIAADESFAEDGTDVTGKVIYDKFSKNPAALFMLKRVAVAAGEDPEMFEAEVDEASGKKKPLILDLDTILGRMMGRRVLASVIVREFKREDGSTSKSNEITKYESVEQATALSASRR